VRFVKSAPSEEGKNYSTLQNAILPPFFSQAFALPNSGKKHEPSLGSPPEMDLSYFFNAFPLLSLSLSLASKFLFS
jgi:hypothetical protein